jgi:hypothetical protein
VAEPGCLKWKITRGHRVIIAVRRPAWINGRLHFKAPLSKTNASNETFGREGKRLNSPSTTSWGSRMKWPRMKHRLNTDQDSLASVFHLWLVFSCIWCVSWLMSFHDASTPSVHE